MLFLLDNRAERIDMGKRSWEKMIHYYTKEGADMMEQFYQVKIKTPIDLSALTHLVSWILFIQ